MTRSYDTPEFLRWSLDRSCPMRPVDRNDDPEWVDRYVRGIRVASEAIATGRVIEGIALEPSACDPRSVPAEPAGFVLDEVLSLQGGAESIAALCDACPANADRATDQSVEWTDGTAESERTGEHTHERRDGRTGEPTGEHAVAPGGMRSDGRPSWGGCFGMIEWSSLGAEFLDAVERVPAPDFGELFLPTRPRWYGIWTTVDWTTDRLTAANRWLDTIRGDIPGADRLFGGLSAGLQAALAAADEGLALRTRLFPGGRVEGTVWTVAAHCRRCAATRGAASVVCDVCGLRGGVTAARQRGVRGVRPYGPLERFLGAAPARALLERYWSHALPGSDGRVS